MPPNPESEEAFALVLNYYQLKGALPSYMLKSIQTRREGAAVFQDVALSVERFPEVHLTLKIPAVFQSPRPALVLFTGFQTGAQAIHLVSGFDNVISVGFDYPWPLAQEGLMVQWDWSRMEAIPIMMAVALSWLSAQPYIDPSRINVVNVSFGTLFYPLAQRILNLEGKSPRTTVFGYGGVEIPEIVAAGVKGTMGRFEVDALKAIVRLQTWFLEPKYSLSQIQGPVLVVNGEQEEVFPPISQEQLILGFKVKPKVEIIPGPHIGPDRKDLIQAFMSLVKQFLIEHQAL